MRIFRHQSPTALLAQQFEHGPHDTALKHVYVHPCVINNRPYIVYPRGLKEHSPALYAQLAAHYTAGGYHLKEDQRTSKEHGVHHQERRRWAPIILFAATMLFESSAHAEVELEIQASGHDTQQKIEVHLISNHKVRSYIEQELNTSKPMTRENTPYVKPSAGIPDKLYTILTRHYEPMPGDPPFVREDLQKIASYYSDYPEVVDMLEALSERNWMLKYDEYDWKTVANGNALKIDNAVIHFNTRAAAQLLLNKKCKDNPVCIASPADALLHELLHAYSMLVNSEKFIAQGGMSNVMYPFKHEYAVIDAERKLYATMSRRDSVRRPQRNDHTGRTIRASCPTCIR